MSADLASSVAAGVISLVTVVVTGWWGYKQAVKVGAQQATAQAEMARRTAEASVELKRIELGGAAAERAHEDLEECRDQVKELLQQLDSERKAHSDEMLATKVALGLVTAERDRLALDEAERRGQQLGTGVVFSRSPRQLPESAEPSSQ